MLKDKVSINIKSGPGGRGSLSVNLEKIDGGDGGNGGSIYLKGSENVYDLAWFDNGKTYKAGRGEDGAGRHKTGSDGADLIILVPLTTEVHINNRTPYKVTKHDEVVQILRGGGGGFGNMTQRRHPDEKLTEEGNPGRTKTITLILKLQSDVIFVGYPNAGKSSLLNLLSDAGVKVAPYAFTTLEPQLGLMDGIRLMDLPGLIEGTYEGKGLGTKFVKHTEHARLVAHFVSYENPDMMAMYKSLRAEIKNISEDLYNKPEIIILMKSDEATPDKVKETEKQFKKAGLTAVSCSIIDDEAIAKVREEFKRLLS